MIFTLVLLLLTLLVAAAAVAMLLPMRTSLKGAVALSGFQLHLLPIAGVFPSLSLLSGLALWRTVFMPNELWRLLWVRSLTALMAVQLVSLLWSPNPLLGVRYFIYALPFLLIASAAYAMACSDAVSSRRLLQIVLYVSAVQSLATIAFRLSPGLKMHYILSPLARLCISANGLEALLTPWGRNNIFDASKSGGLFFINANVAAAYLGVSAVLAWGLAVRNKSLPLHVVAFMNWVAVLCTGSKAGVICSVAVPAGMWLFQFANTRRLNANHLVAAVPVISVTVVALYACLDSALLNRFTYQSASTLDVRQQIWTFALSVLEKHPLKGIGFGGWELKFPLFAAHLGINPNLPPHNSLLILWTQSGLAAMLLGVVFAVSLIAWLLNSLRQAEGDDKLLVFGVLGAVTWYVIQGMGENFGLVGEEHMTPLLAMSIGYVASLHCRAQQARVTAESGAEDVSRTHQAAAPP